MMPLIALAHGGRLDQSGGHNDRKQGTYHCHKAPCGTSAKKTLNTSPGYNRKHWKHWSDVDHDCMNTRHEILQAQADGPIKLSPDGCYISTGTWLDPFSGEILHRASELDVDHIVPLKWASDHGGSRWTLAKKERFANDPINLLAVDDGLNQSKGAKGPSKWMPPNHKFRCEYIALWSSVLTAYPDLQMVAQEQRIFNRQRSACQ